MKNNIDLKNLNDNILLDLALKERNQKAWTELVARYYGKVAATVYRIMGQTPDSADVVQEVFIEMAKAANTYRQDSAFSTFLYRIAVNTTYRCIQRISSRVEESSSDQEFLMQLRDQTPDNDESLIKKERAKMVNDAMKRLSPDKRLVLVLYEIEGIPLKDISAMLKQPVQTVWSRINQAKKQLCGELSESIEK